MQKFIKNFTEAESLLHGVDHLIYVSFPMIKDKRILLTSLEKLRNCAVKCINSLLQYEYLHRRVKLYKDPHLNMKTFESKCARRYGFSETDLNSIKELFKFYNFHKKSSMEFMKNGDIFMLVNGPTPIRVNLEKIKILLNATKNLFNKIRHIIIEKRS